LTNVLVGRPVIWSKIGPGQHVSEDSSSNECISLASRWLRGCLSSHLACKRAGTQILPTRVIELGACNEEMKLFVNEKGESAEYAALSHCWGNSHPITLTKATLEQMQKNLVLDDSCKTFKDAADVTRRLGIPYLWIDSLCILQDKDDVSDWQEEATRMSEVYNSATVTISAAASLGSADGLFTAAEERQSRNKTVKLSCPGNNGHQEFVYVRARFREPFNIQEIVHSSLSPETPVLSSRGWVLQEDLLSPRMLHFRKEELAWTCSTYSRCECRLRPSLPLPHPFRAAPGTRTQGPELTHKLEIQWPLIVVDYTHRNLTKSLDRAMAVTGLAKYMSTETSDTYHSGLWYEDMAFQLLWYVDRQNLSAPVPARFEYPYAPSWSWISIPAPISYYGRYSNGSVLSDPASETEETVKPLLGVHPVGRIMNVWAVPQFSGSLLGPYLIAPLCLAARVLPISFDILTQQWKPTTIPVEDFIPAILKVYIDDDQDMPACHPHATYVLLLAGQWYSGGMTLTCMQAVCILARRLSKEAKHKIELTCRMQDRVEKENGIDKKNLITPTLANSYERIGLVRGAGSVEAWLKADIPSQCVYLL